MSDRFGQLLYTLNQSELEMNSYELADMCWLLLHAPQIAEQTEKKSKKPKPRKELEKRKLQELIMSFNLL